MNEVTHDIAISSILLDPHVWARTRTGFDEERTALFMSLFEAGGADALPPVVLVPVGDGTYYSETAGAG